MKDGRWRAEKIISGRRRTKTFQTKKSAKAWESTQSAERWEREAQQILSTSCLEWATAYLQGIERHVSESTHKEKQACFRDFFTSVPSSLPVNELTAQQVAKFLTHQSKKISGNRANKDRKNLIAAWTWGQDFLSLPDVNPIKKVKPYPTEPCPRYIPPKEDVYKILEYAEPENHTFLLTLLHTAARKGEIINLKWSDVDLENGNITLHTRKRQSGSLERDTIPLTGILRDELSLHKKRSFRGIYVFTREDGQKYTKRRHLMEKVCRDAGVKYFDAHAIRHVSALMLDEAGINLSTIRDILRHKSITTTDRYLRRIRGIRAQLDNVFLMDLKKPPESSSEGGL